MKSEDIQHVYFNKDITDRPVGEYGDRLGLFCVIVMKPTEHQAGRKQRTCDLLTGMMKLMGYPGEISSANFAGELEINHCWIREEEDARLSIQHKYWNGQEIKLFCEIMEAVGRYLHFEIEYLPADTLRNLSIERHAED